jgi:two-component system response regulator NreC
MPNIRILVCEDHALTREGIVNRFSGQPGIFVVGEAASGAKMIAQYEKLKPDLIISDIEMPPGISGTDALKQLKLKYPLIKVLFVSVYGGEPYIYIIIKAGGLGLLDKSPAKGELLYAINEAMEGRQYFGPHFNNEQIAAIMDQYNHPPKKFIIDPGKIPTDIEHKILMLIGDFFQNKEIAAILSLSPRTIETHRSDLIEKFGLKNGLALNGFAMKYKESKENPPKK